MSITVSQLDGRYRIEVQKADPAAADDHLTFADGDETVIENGMSFRKHANGFIWESSFTIAGHDCVEMVSTVDPSHGAADAFVTDDKGNRTKGMVTYRATLQAGIESGTLVLRGEVRHGGDVTRLTFTRIG